MQCTVYKTHFTPHILFLITESPSFEGIQKVCCPWFSSKLCQISEIIGNHGVVSYHRVRLGLGSSSLVISILSIYWLHVHNKCMHSLDRELLKHEADISSVFAILLSYYLLMYVKSVKLIMFIWKPTLAIFRVTKTCRSASR